MSKIICEVCGTAYPEASTQCPICGCVRAADAQVVANNTEEAPQERAYQHVKGGRFSKSNVRKRTLGNQSATYAKPEKPVRSNTPTQTKKTSAKKKKNGNMGLVYTIFALLLAIIAVVVYILIKFLVPAPSNDKIETAPPTEPTELIEISDVTDEPADEVFCQELSLDKYEIRLEKAADYDYLNPILEPFDTTEEVTYESADESIAMAEPDGCIRAVRKGETVVTVTCGSVTAQCKVIVGVPKVEFVLDSDSVSLWAPGESVVIYTGEILVDEISWYTDDPTVATVSSGVVTAVGSGTTTVYGKYNDEIQSCAVFCEFPEATEPAIDDDGEQETVETEPTEPVETEPTEPTEPPATEAPSSEYVAPFMIRNVLGNDNKEASVNVGGSFLLELVDSNGKHVNGVTWSVDGSCCTVSDGTVKGVRSGNCTIVATYGGQTYKFKVIVW